MLAVEFQTVIRDGMIKLPESYANWQEKSVKVILLTVEDSIAQIKPRRKPGSAKGKITMQEDFDAPLEDFKEYMP
ncbi:MAG: DUF2281 domain-containing protein [Thiotrichaceae bacterium]